MDATTYIALLVQDNEIIKNHLGAYLNSLLLIYAKYSRQANESDEQYSSRIVRSLETTEKENLLNIINVYRSYATRIMLSLNSINLTKETKITNLQTIQQHYLKIKSCVLPDYESVESFAQEVNNTIAENINISQLLLESQKSNELSKLYEG